MAVPEVEPSERPDVEAARNWLRRTNQAPVIRDPDVLARAAAVVAGGRGVSDAEPERAAI